MVERRYARLPAVICNVNELNQVWTNLIHNAIQAMKGMGRITIETYQRGRLRRGPDHRHRARASPRRSGAASSTRSSRPRTRARAPAWASASRSRSSSATEGGIEVESEPGRTSFEVLLPLLPQAVEAEA